MKHPQTFLALLLIAAPAQLYAQTKSDGWTPALMMKVKRVGSVQASPDGKLVAFTVRQAVMDEGRSEYLTHIFLSRPNDAGRSVRLTGGVKSCDDPQWSPDGQWIAFVTARSGKKDIWIIKPDGGEAEQVTSAKTGVISFKWSPDGTSLAYTELDPLTAEEVKNRQQKNDARVVDENVKMVRLYICPARGLAQGNDRAKPQAARKLTEGDFSVGGEGNRPGRAPFDWSPDGGTIVFSHTRTPSPNDWTTADLSLVDLKSGKVRLLFDPKSAPPRKGVPPARLSPLYSPDGQAIVFVESDAPATWPGHKRICLASAKGGFMGYLADTTDGFGRYSELVGWSADGKDLYFTEAQGTNLKLLAIPGVFAPLKSSPYVIQQGDGMSLGGVSLNASRTVFGFGWEQLDQAPEAFIHVAANGKVMGKSVQVSKIQDELPKVPLGRTEVVAWKSSDGLDVEGLLTYPVGYEKGKRYPLLLIVHGGPAGVFMQTYDGTAGPYPVAAFASRGYAVLRPNPRGSSGYGVKFRYANRGDWGGGDFKDIMTGVDHVIKMGVGDAERMGVMGWSYGGYMTSWTITQTRRFKAASVGAGVTNLMSFTGTADIPSFLPDYFGGEFWDKFDDYRGHSAMFHVKGVTTPTLIQHGDKDERVPLSQGLEFYNALKRQGCTTKMVIYPRTPHGIEEPRLLIDCMERNLEWFDRYVLSR